MSTYWMSHSRAVAVCRSALKESRRAVGAVVVDTIALSEAFCNVADFVASGVACIIIIMVAFADKFPF